MFHLFFAEDKKKMLHYVECPSKNIVLKKGILMRCSNMLNVTVREFLRFLLIPFAFITINLVELTAAVITFSRSSAATSVTLLNTVVILSCKPATLLLTTVISGAFDLNAETVLLNADIRAFPAIRASCATFRYKSLRNVMSMPAAANISSVSSLSTDVNTVSE